jgi:hypothetical protein
MLILFLLAWLWSGTPVHAGSLALTGAGGGSSCVAISPPSGGIYDSPTLAGSGTANATLTTNAVLSPDCTIDAATVVETTATGVHQLNPNNTTISHTFSAASATFTIYANECVGTRNIQLLIFDPTLTYLAAVTVTPSTGGVVTAAATTFAGAAASSTETVESGGWTKITLTVSPITATGVAVYTNASNGTSTNYAGDGTSTLCMWGAGVTSP